MITLLLAALYGHGATDMVLSATGEDAAIRAVRAALNTMMHGSQRDRAAAAAIHAKFFLGRTVSARDKNLARGIRRLRSFPEVRAALKCARPVYWPDPARPGGGWVTIRQASALTGYSESHLRGYVLPKFPAIRRRRWGTLLYIHRRDILRYAHQQKRRGYGAQSGK